MTLIAVVLALALVGVSAQQQPTVPPPPDAPIVIPPAVVGLDAAPDELQKALDESGLPKSVPALLVELAKRATDIQQTIASGAFGQVWVPAMATKTVALVLESHTSELPDGDRMAATAAIKQIVTSAWELDTYGDLGNKQQIDGAYSRLATGVMNLKAAYTSAH